MSQTQIAIHGAAGRMGRRLIALGSLDHDLKIAAALDAPDSPDLDKDAGTVAGVGPLGIHIHGALNTDVDVVIDFSVPSGAESITETCVERSIALVMATTGLNDHQKDMLRQASHRIPLVWAPNMSLAVNLAMKLVSVAAEKLEALPNGVDVEVIERHHRFKEDAPSGTALKFGEIISGVMGQTRHAHGRQGLTGRRPSNEIGYHALRVGDNPGEHTIVFGMLGETIELTVRATNRDCYALGALAAAKFAARQQPGLYTMKDVLEL